MLAEQPQYEQGPQQTQTCPKNGGGDGGRRPEMSATSGELEEVIVEAVEFPQDTGRCPPSGSDKECKSNDEAAVHRVNMFLLLLVCILFGGFAIAQMIFAIAGNSLSLIGDSSCMIVDAVTYGLNMIAERLKVRGVTERTRLRLELFIPFVSMCGLIATSIYIIDDASATISAGPLADDSTDDIIMIIFSSINLGIDVVSMFFFVRARGCCGFRTVDEVTPPDAEPSSIRNRSNMNMCSAYTHVTADTMRSSAVVVAAIVSIKGENVHAGIADAWAAVAVSIIIFLSMIPLVRGMVQKISQLRKLDAQS
ncbi:Hypothetical Protein FCC1311_110572 [Hondaea fermentalgiana]|uniref:Cation efflux protein transmembrane domain-containing protein n=1 Tax=Hondaea fermentalgiana TaxID=2315210 RepID=A0A2R5GW82_9STRA|nr:Hypothetical Protein FCC1311_110572 [Hondaea fermentalgiana]|eukprot:GBG34835.1 Hypothetical Protein FCC1311_110572 [Hondaea fermentalgiana]